MVQLLANLADLVARGCVRRFGCSPVACALERVRDATEVEPETSGRSFGPPVVAGAAGRDRVWRMVSHFRPQLSNFLNLRSILVLASVPFPPAQNRDWHLCSL